MDGVRGWLSNRRSVLAGLAVSAAGAAAGMPAIQASAPWRRSIVIDGLSDLEEFHTLAKVSPENIAQIRESGITALTATAGTQGNVENGYDLLLQDLDRRNAVIRSNPDVLLPVRTAEDVRAAKRTHRLGIIHTVQDSAWIGADVARIAMAKTRGLRVIQLTYNKANLAGDGALEQRDADISDLGRETITAIEHHRLALDLSHAGSATILSAIKHANRPMLISHTGAAAVRPHPRNVGDAQLRACAEKGGCSGIYFMSYLAVDGKPRREHLIAHLEHMLSICGEDHISIGTDGGIAPIVIDAEMREANRRNYEARKARGIAAPGEGPDIFTFVPDYNRPEKLGMLANDLAARGWPWSRIEKLMGLNYLRVCADAWAA